jgi:hypothetical protein
MANKSEKARTRAADPKKQNKELADAEHRANATQPRNFADDRLTDKQVHVEPDGTGPTPTDSFDSEKDRERGSGSED